jgi:hypothetical protein
LGDQEKTETDMERADGQVVNLTSPAVDVEAEGAELFGVPARTLRAAYAGLPDDDARRLPCELRFIDEESNAINDRRRWTRNHSDLLALRLQFGRGVDTADVAAQFDMAKKSVLQRAREGRWSRALSEANRINLGRRVWIAGLVRLGRVLEEEPGATIPAATLDKLREASAWQAVPPKGPLWAPLDGSAHDPVAHREASEHEREKHALLNDPKNPDRTYRERVAANLERLAARLEKQQREKAAAETAAVNSRDNSGEPENLSNGGL